MPKRIMIAVVDDDEALREALTSLMKSLGYAAAAFKSAEDFLRSSGWEHASCIIADVQMPGMTGPDLHRDLVASGNPIPIVLITAYPDEDIKARALRAGVKGYLTKPFNETDLLSCIHAALADKDLSL